MDEERSQDYVNLINVLLNCPSSEEPQILNANRDLVDAGLVETMQEVAEEFADRGDENAANFLIKIAGQLAEALSLSSSIPTSDPLPAPDSHTLSTEMINPELSDERTQAYLSLIDKLLACSSGEEEEILKKNRSLIDAGFVKTAQWLAAEQAKQDNQIVAELLHGVAQVAASLTREVHAFLVKVLQATSDSNGAPQVVYPLWRTNLEKLDNDFAQVVRLWATAVLSEVEPERAIGIAEALGNFSKLILEFPDGNKACNQEIALAGFEVVETVFTRKAFAEAWAATQHNLASAYIERCQGEKLKNLRQAIAYCDKALEVYTRDAFPVYRGVGYAPSCQLLQMTQKQNKSDFSRLFAVQDPDQTLPFANTLVETILQYFHEDARVVLVREAATKEALNDAPNAESLRLAHCFIFSGHGKYIFESPLQSHLRLANDTLLTFGEIFDLDLSQCRLVILSACETGLTYPNSSSDEYMGLVSGFLFAGCSNIAYSLWEVTSISTTLLIREFFKNLFENLRTHQKLEVVLALNKAQKWLCELTSEECEKILRDEIEPQVQEIIKQLPKKRRRYQASLDAAYKGIRDRQPRPFASPYYWAAFTVMGV